MTESRSESASLRSLGRGQRSLQSGLSAQQERRFSAALAEIRAQSRADYCAVVSPTRASIWPTPTSGYKGKSATEQGNVTDRWGEIVELQFVDDNGKADARISRSA